MTQLYAIYSQEDIFFSCSKSCFGLPQIPNLNRHPHTRASLPRPRHSSRPCFSFSSPPREEEGVVVGTTVKRPPLGGRETPWPHQPVTDPWTVITTTTTARVAIITNIVPCTTAAATPESAITLAPVRIRSWSRWGEAPAGVRCLNRRLQTFGVERRKRLLWDSW